DQGRLHRPRRVLLAADDRSVEDRAAATLATDEPLALEVRQHGGDGRVRGLGLREFDDLPNRERLMVPQQSHHLLLEGAEAYRRGAPAPIVIVSHERTLLSGEGSGHEYWPLRRMITATSRRATEAAARIGWRGAK